MHTCCTCFMLEPNRHTIIFVSYSSNALYTLTLLVSNTNILEETNPVMVLTYKQWFCLNQFDSPLFLVSVLQFESHLLSAVTLDVKDSIKRVIYTSLKSSEIWSLSRLSTSKPIPCKFTFICLPVKELVKALGDKQLLTVIQNVAFTLNFESTLLAA